MTVKILKLKPDAKIPVYSSQHAAGADLYSLLPTEVTIQPNKTVLIPTGISMEIATGYAGFIYARSGLATKKGLVLANQVGIIDSDYRGEIMISIYNRSGDEQTISNHERIAQIVIAPYIQAEFVESLDLSDTERGEGGFGSTGDK